MSNSRDYCSCNDCSSVYIDDDEWGIWDVCAKCGKIVEGSYKAYNHYDGEDHLYDSYDED